MPLFDDSLSKQRYCEKLDEFQALLFGSLQRAYRNPYFSRLVALKVCNLLAAEYHFHHRHAWLASRPVQLLVDPCNGCQLRCPGCVHSDNKTWTAQFDWPQGMLSVEQAALLFDQAGPFACAAVFFNYGEPLLNRHFPEIVAVAKRYGLFTMTASNLAMHIEPDRLVECGLDRLTVSADGTSQATYEQFRRGGRLSTVLDNVAAIVKAKRRRHTDAPYIVWQFLTFEHNYAEVDRAIELASKLGINEIHFVAPFAVDGDDPSLRPAFTGRGQIVLHPAAAVQSLAPKLPPGSEERVDAAFRTPWLERLNGGGLAEEPSRAPAATCGWLYHNLTVDGARRVMPCCKAPLAADGRASLVFQHLEANNGDLMNSRRAVLARTVLAGGEAAATALRNTDTQELPPCINCPAQPPAPYGFDVGRQIRMLDVLGAIPDTVYENLRQCALYAAARGER